MNTKSFEFGKSPKKPQEIVVEKIIDYIKDKRKKNRSNSLGNKLLPFTECTVDEVDSRSKPRGRKSSFCPQGKERESEQAKLKSHPEKQRKCKACKRPILKSSTQVDADNEVKYTIDSDNIRVDFERWNSEFSGLSEKF